MRGLEERRGEGRSEKRGRESGKKLGKSDKEGKLGNFARANRVAPRRLGGGETREREGR